MRDYFSRTFYALENPLFRTLWFGTVWSFLGMQMQVIARGFLAYDLTGKNSALGAVMLSFGVPQLLLGLWGGVFADRLPKRKVLVVAQTLIALNSAWLATMIAFDLIAFWMLIVAGVVQGAGFAFVGPSRQAYIGDLVGKEQLGNAVVLQQLSMNSTRVIGPSLAGLLIAIPFIGIAGVYYFTTFGFFIATFTMMRLPPGNPQPGARGSPLAEMRDGLAYVASRKAILLLILTSFMIIMVGFGYQSFLPSLAKAEYNVGAGGLGLLASVGAVGAVFATVVVATLAGSPRAWFYEAAAGIAFGIGLIGLGLAPVFVVGLLAMVIVGAFASAFQSLNNSLTMQLTEHRYHGRVQSITMLSWSLFGLAALPIGILADNIGLRETLVLMGAFCILAIIAIEIAGKAMHAAEDRRPAVQERARAHVAGGR